MKHCCKCEELKSKNDFGFYSNSKDGLRGECKDCRKTYSDTNKDMIKRQKQIYYDTNRGRLLVKLNQNRKKYKYQYTIDERVKNPVRYKALKSYKIYNRNKTSCIICNDEHSEAHHEDYTKPLEVIWLCKTHHGELHRNKRRGINVE